jgi:molybdopterin molybdotransferase
MITVKTALAIVLKSTRVLRSQMTPLSSAQGKVLAQDAVSDSHIPPLDNSSMDGFGLKNTDSKNARPASPVKLKIVGTVYAGQVFCREIHHHEAVRVMTGTVIPQGVDAVVKLEDTTEKHGYVYIYNQLERGSYIRKQGEDIRKNEKVIRKGKVLKPAEIGMLAALGYAKVKVIKTPRVAVLATGDELVALGKKPVCGQIRDVNSYSLIAALKECGCESVGLGIVQDTPQRLAAFIRQGLKCDALIISGGVSMGDKDFVRPVLKSLGVNMKFWKVAQRPGQPFAFGIYQQRPVFCLPGNPVSTLTTFETLVRPALFKMSGRTEYARPQVMAELQEDIRVQPGNRYFLRVKLTERNHGSAVRPKGVTADHGCQYSAKAELADHKYYARLTGSQGSGILKSMVLADGLLVIPETIGLIKKGAHWPITLLKSF